MSTVHSLEFARDVGVRLNLETLTGIKEKPEVARRLHHLTSGVELREELSLATVAERTLTLFDYKGLTCSLASPLAISMAWLADPVLYELDKELRRLLISAPYFVQLGRCLFGAEVPIGLYPEYLMRTHQVHDQESIVDNDYLPMLITDEDVEWFLRYRRVEFWILDQIQQIPNFRETYELEVEMINLYYKEKGRPTFHTNLYHNGKVYEYACREGEPPRAYSRGKSQHGPSHTHADIIPDLLKRFGYPKEHGQVLLSDLVQYQDSLGVSQMMTPGSDIHFGLFRDGSLSRGTFLFSLYCPHITVGGMLSLTVNTQAKVDELRERSDKYTIDVRRIMTEASEQVRLRRDDTLRRSLFSFEHEHRYTSFIGYVDHHTEEAIIAIWKGAPPILVREFIGPPPSFEERKQFLKTTVSHQGFVPSPGEELPQAGPIPSSLPEVARLD